MEDAHQVFDEMFKRDESVGLASFCWEAYPVGKMSDLGYTSRFCLGFDPLTCHVQNSQNTQIFTFLQTTFSRFQASADEKFGSMAEYRHYKSVTSPLILLPPALYESLPLWFKKVFLFEFPLYNKGLPQEDISGLQFQFTLVQLIMKSMRSKFHSRSWEMRLTTFSRLTN